MMSRSFFMVVMLIAGVTVNAQEMVKERQGGILGLGMGYGYDSVLGPDIKGQVVVSGMEDVTLGSAAMMNLRIGYSNASERFGNGQPDERDYDWRNVFVLTAVFQRLSSVGAVGLGAGLDWMKYSRRTVITRSSYDAQGNNAEVTLYGGEIGWNSMAPSFSVLANSEFVLQQGARVTIQFYYKFSFPGKVSGRSPYNSVNTMGVTFAFMRDMSL